jgi:hypothetical protein
MSNTSYRSRLEKLEKDLYKAPKSNETTLSSYYIYIGICVTVLLLLSIFTPKILCYSYKKNKKVKSYRSITKITISWIIVSSILCYLYFYFNK